MLQSVDVGANGPVFCPAHGAMLYPCLASWPQVMLFPCVEDGSLEASADGVNHTSSRSWGVEQSLMPTSDGTPSPSTIVRRKTRGSRRGSGAGGGRRQRGPRIRSAITSCDSAPRHLDSSSAGSPSATPDVVSSSSGCTPASQEGELTFDSCPSISAETLLLLQNGNRDDRQRAIAWLVPAARALAVSPNGCRAVQKALEVATVPDCHLLVAALEPHVVELYESPHGNHVLTKAIEVMPSSALGPIIARLCAKGGAEVAKHRFGCRVLERLIEHCSDNQIAGLMEDVVAEAEALSYHQFGNFVVQHLIEHGAARDAVCRRLLPACGTLAAHRTASHVVQRALDYANDDSRRAVVRALLDAASPRSLVEAACGRYGSFVVEQLAGATWLDGDLAAELRDRLMSNFDKMNVSQFGRRVLEKFGLNQHDAAPIAFVYA